MAPENPTVGNEKSTKNVKNQIYQSQQIESVPTIKTNIVILIMLVVYILLNIAGALVFEALEKKPTEGKLHWLPEFKSKFLENHSSCLSENQLETFLAKLEEAARNDSISIVGNSTIYPLKWNLNSGFFLTFTIASTIGYGNVTPVTPQGQIFTIILALTLIPFSGILAAKMGIVMAYYMKKVFSYVCYFSKIRFANVYFCVIFGLILYIFTPTILLYFVDNEEEWTFINCLYFTIISLTTIGFGDFIPDPSQHGGFTFSILVLIWVIAGLAWFASIIKMIASQISKSAEMIQDKIVAPHSSYGLCQSGSEIQEFSTGKKEFYQEETIPSENQIFVDEGLRKSNETSLTNEKDVAEQNLNEDYDNSIAGPGSFHAAIMAHNRLSNKMI